MTNNDGRWIVYLGTSLCVLCIAYFSALDHGLLSSANFTLMFRMLLESYDATTVWLGGVVWLGASAWNLPARVHKLVDSLSAHCGLVVLTSVLLTALGSIYIYHRYALSMDEYAAVFQSKLFASGRIYAQLPAALVDWFVVSGFNGSFLFASPVTGKVIEGYWPGFALLLTPFQWLGVPGLCNALLAGAAVYLIYRVTLEITGDARAAGWAMLFTLASSVFWANAISFYAMQAHMTANLLFAWLLLRPTPMRALSAGIVGSIALALHNPFPHLLFAAPWLLAIALDESRRRLLVPLVLGYLPLSLLLVVGWSIFRADILSMDGGNFAQVQSLTQIFVWPDTALLDMRVAALAKMWVWAMPGLFVLAVFGRKRLAADRRVRLLMQSAVLTFLGYCFVKLDQGHGWGYRYFHSAWGVIPVLAAAAMKGTAGVINAPAGAMSANAGTIKENSGASDRVAGIAGAAAVLSLAVLVPFQMRQIDQVMTEHLAQIPLPQRPGNNVYFIHPGRGFYVADMVQFDPLLRDQDLYLVSRGGALDDALIRQNWPDATKLGGSAAADQWVLGPGDRRESTPGTRDARHFIFKIDAATRSR